MKKILVVEDEATQILLLQMRLKEEGFQVITAMNGKDGLRKASEELPDLVLLDVVLPGMSGIDVCIALQADPKTSDIPVLLLTASGMRDLEDRCKVFGVRGCLIKPYAMPNLLEKIHQILPADPAATS